MLLLLFDTETNGLPVGGCWPRLIQLAWQLVADDVCVERASLLVQPADEPWDEKALAVHGITHERASREGLPLEDVLAQFSLAMRADAVICHNLQFDRGVIDNAVTKT